MELKKAIPDAPEYFVFSDGRIYNKKKDLFLKPFLAGNYYAVKINGKNRYIHRLAAKFFVPGYWNGAEINHKDENKGNNSAWNLEWVSHKKNCNYGTRNARAGEKHKKPIASFKNGILQASFESLSEAAEKTGICIATIGNVANGKGKTAGGFEWRYA